MTKFGSPVLGYAQKIDDTAYRALTIISRTGVAETADGLLPDSLVIMDNAEANQLTVNAGLLAPGWSFSVMQAGAGLTTLVAGDGVTLRYESTASLVLRGQWAVVSLICIASNEYLVVGALADAA